MSLALLTIGRHCAPGRTRQERHPLEDGAPGVSGRDRSLEGVLDLLAGLLQVPGDLVLGALGLQVSVVGGLAERLLAFAGELLRLVLHLVYATHGLTSSGPSVVVPDTPVGPV